MEEKKELEREEFLCKAKELQRRFNELYISEICGVGSNGIHMTDTAFRKRFDLTKCKLTAHNARNVNAEVEEDGITYFALL